MLTVRRGCNHELLGKTWLIADVGGQPRAIVGGVVAHRCGLGVGHLQRDGVVRVVGDGDEQHRAPAPKHRAVAGGHRLRQPQLGGARTGGTGGGHLHPPEHHGRSGMLPVNHAFHC